MLHGFILISFDFFPSFLSHSTTTMAATDKDYLGRFSRNDTTLTTLDLSSNLWTTRIELSEGLAIALSTNSTLTSLNLWNNQIRTAGSRWLAEALAFNSIITKFSKVNSLSTIRFVSR